MRVAKTDTIAGLPAALARSIVRKFRGREMVAEAVGDLLEGTEFEHEAVLAELEAAGYMEKVRVDTDGDVWWDSTIQGNALAMASFGKPISRKTADRLVSGLVERAQAYNADPGKPLFVGTLRVFGSYLSPDVDPLGDVDIELTYGRRIARRGSRAVGPERIGGMDKFEIRTGIRQDSVLEVRVELVDSEPEIWRLFELRGSLTLSQVHRVLQAAFGWEDAHLHRFVTSDPFAPLRPVNGEFPEVPQWLPGQQCEEPGDRPEEDFSLDQLLTLGSGEAFYEYDFSDSWLHRLELVSRRPADDKSPPARLVDGARRGPLEDSGGIPGYEEVMDALADPSHPDHDEHAAWVADMTRSAEPFDPAYLDIPAVNRVLAEQF